MKVIKNILIYLLVLTGSVCAMAQNTVSGASLMDAMAEKMSAPSVQAQFTASADGADMQGHITISGARFLLDSPNIKVWYNGTDQWTFLPSSGEVSLTTPTAEDLMTANPFAILRNYSAAYRVRRISDQAGKKRVELTPKVPGEIAKVVITVAADKWPSAAEVTFDDGRRVKLSVDHIQPGASVPVSTFRFDPARFPGVEVIDLR